MGHTQALPNVGGDVDSAFSYAEVFDQETRSWTLAGISDTGRHSHTASVLPSGQVLVVGGSSAELQHLDTAELYDTTLLP